MSEDSDSDYSDEDFEWDPEVRELLDDFSWWTKTNDMPPVLDSGIHLIQSGALCYPSILLQLFHDKEVKIKDETKIPTPKIPYGKTSSLSQNEMDNYIRMVKQFKQKSISDVPRKQHRPFREYKQIQAKLIKEQEEYQHYLLQVANMFIAEYNYIDKEAAQWMKICLNAAADQIKRYERYYVHLKDFGICVIPFKNDPLPAPFENLIVHLGTLKHLKTVTNSVPIPDNINCKQKTKPNNDQESETEWKKTVVSEDENARRLAIAWNADVVISLGSLKMLADNHPPFSNEWEIPIIVKEIESFEFGIKRKVAFVDKPLPPKRVTPREKNWQYLKEVFKSVAEVQNVWDKFPSSINPVETDQQTETEVENKVAPRTSSSEFGNSSDDETLMQVDGAGDKKTKKNRKPSEKNADNLVSKDGSEIEKLKSPHPAKFPSFIELDTRTTFDQTIFTSNKTNESGFSPFIGKRTKSTSRESTKSKANDRNISKISNKSQFSGMSFSLLPDSALGMSQDNPGDAENTHSKESPQGQVMKIEPNSPENTTRRSTRKSTMKKKQSKKPSPESQSTKDLFFSFGKMSKEITTAKKTSKMMTSTPAPVGNKKKKNLQQISSSENESDDDIPLAAAKRKTVTSNETGKEFENSTMNETQSSIQASDQTFDLLSTILPPQSDTSAAESSNTSKLASLKPFKPSSDLLGQILGKKSFRNQTLKDVSSAWSSEAESLREGDSGLKYSSSDISLLHPSTGKNVTYTLWKFGKARVLIRYTLHGKLTPPKSFISKDSKKTGGVSLRTKLEYQSDYVFEQLTMSEMCRDWVTILFKRPTKLVRSRIDPLKRKILEIEWTMTLNDLQDKAELMGYNSGVTSKLLVKLLQMISELKGGSYLCCHRVDEKKVVLREAVDDIRKKVVYDLGKEYARPGRDVFYSTSAPWIPGDPNKPRKFHNFNNRVPMTFDPREENETKKKKKK